MYTLSKLYIILPNIEDKGMPGGADVRSGDTSMEVGEAEIWP